ncbi:MAG: hypothetical protein ACE5HX_00595 [bacterium]
MIKTEFNLKQIVKNYKRKNRIPVLWDFKFASNELLNNESIKDNRYIQYIHYYPGRIYPYIPLYILSLNEFVHLDGYVLDPFAGSGTILLEALLNPLIKRNALGVEINPLGRLISKVKTTPIDVFKIQSLQERIFQLYSQAIDIDSHIPNFENLNLWFSRGAINKLAKLKYAIENLDVCFDYKDFFLVCFSSIVRKVSRADPYIPPPVILRPEKYQNNRNSYQKLKRFLEQAENPNVWQLFENTVKNNMAKLELLNSIEKLKSREIIAEIIWDDARKIKKGWLVESGKIDKSLISEIPANSVDIIFTSPPYLTAQKYIRTSKLELLWLGYNAEELYELDKTSVGTERIDSKTEISELGIDSIDLLISCTFSNSKERGLNVYNYFKNMIIVLKEMHRLVKNNGYTILVVGNNRVLREKVDTYRLLTDAAIHVGFQEFVILRDKIRTRSMMTKRNGTGGLIKDEYVIILKKEI